MRPLLFACSVLVGLQLILVSDTAGQRKLVRLQGDGRLGPEADEHRRTSSAYGYEGTPHSVVSVMIELAAVNKDDVVYEPGCGDARILIAAVRAGAKKGLGVDIDPNLAEGSYAEGKAAGLTDQIEIYWGNALAAD